MTAVRNRSARPQEHHGVAITGMSCLFPGAPDLDAYWQNILDGVDAVTDPPPEAWDTDVYYDPAFADTDKVYCKRGGYLGSLASFDPLSHGIPPVAVGGEPDQWLALQVAQDALVDAGCAELPADRRHRTGIVLGKGTYLNEGNAVAVQRGLMIAQTLELVERLNPELSPDRIELLRQEMKRALPSIGPETVPGLIPNVIVGRIANRLDLMGPAYTVDAACASSLVAVQLAMRDLLEGECDLALAGGCQVWMPVPTLNVFCHVGALSRRQQIRPFDKDADGTLLGEGLGMVVLKRVADAVRDGDRIYAVIRGVGVSSDGRGAGVMAPRVEGEVLALQRAYEEAGVSPETVGLVEAHGTATAVGDVVEMQALTRVFGGRDGDLPRCALGTVKSMISHTIPASGVAGLIKLALALHHRVLPPTLHCSEPNPELELGATPFYINSETRPWIHGGPEARRAGINAFGFGGINTHAVLEEFAPVPEEAQGHRPDLDHLPRWDSELCVLESDSASGLAEEATRLAAALNFGAGGDDDSGDASTPYTLTDLGYTLSRRLGRIENPVRLAVVAESFADLRQKLESAAARLRKPGCRQIKGISGIYFAAKPLGREGSVVFAFPGEGAQYAGMLADLCLHFPEVREAFDRFDRIYFGHPRGYLPSDYVFPRPAFSEEERRRAEHRLMQMDSAIEAVLAANQGVLALLRRLGVEPHACVGHSSGEYSAALAAGVLDLDSDERLRPVAHAMHAYGSDAASREDLPRAALLAIAAGRERVEAVAREAGAYVAMDNCPHQAVLVAEGEAAGRAREIAAREGLIYEQLAYDRAVHTPLFAPFSEDLRPIFADAEIRPAETSLYSSSTVAQYPTDPAEVRALFVEHWARPVEFRRTIETLYEEGARVFVEVGPRGNLTAFIEDILRGRAFCAVPADVQRRSGVTQLNHLVGMLCAHGLDLDAGYLYARRAARDVAWEEPDRSVEKPKGAAIQVGTRWPMLRLSQEVIDRIVPDHESRERSDAPPAATTVDTPAVHAAQAAGLEPSDQPRTALELSGDATAEPAAAARQDKVSPAVDEVPVHQPDVGSVIEEDAGSAAVDRHLETMDQFLSVQEQVMQAYLLGDERSVPVMGGEASGGREARIGPLLGAVVSSVPDTELVTRRVFDLGGDLYLRDHTFGGVVSTTDDLLGLAVMPLAMSLEIIAEAAAALLPRRQVVGLRDVRAYRWLACGDEAHTVEVTARRLPADGRRDRVAVTLRDLTEDGRSGDVSASPVVEATVVLDDGYPAPPPPRGLELPEGRPSRWDSARLYRDGMFHGPSWQGVTAIERTAPSGTVASLEVLPWSGFLASTTHPRFVLDPVVLDAAGQVIGFWTAEQLETRSVIFPFRLEALDVFGPPRRVGEAISCSAAVDLRGHHAVRSDIDVVASDGRLWMRMTGWEDKRFDLPAPLRPLLERGGRGTITEEWPGAIAPLDDGSRVRCRRAPATVPPDRGLWTRVWAHRVLTRAELDRFKALPGNEQRRLEWLAARTAAKEAVQELLRASYGLELLPADIEIAADDRGRPVVRGAWLASLDHPPVVSQAHTDGMAVAVAGVAARRPAGGDGQLRTPPRLGIDIERVRPRGEGFPRAAFSEEEGQLLEPVPSAQVEEWRLRCWCAKEAVAKALGSGLVDGPRSASVVGLDLEREQVAVRLAGSLAAAHPDAADLDLLVHTVRSDDLIAATTACEPMRREAEREPTIGRRVTPESGVRDQGDLRHRGRDMEGEPA